VLNVNFSETGVVIGPSRPRFHSVTTAGPLLTSPTSSYGKSSSSVMFPTSGDSSGGSGDSVFISASHAVTPKVSSVISPTSYRSDQDQYRIHVNEEVSSSSTSSSSTTHNNRSIYVSLTNVPHGKSFSRSFPTNNSSSGQRTPPTPSTRLLLSSTILPPSNTSPASQTACIYFLILFFCKVV
jgi:hypothetical protein